MNQISRRIHDCSSKHEFCQLFDEAGQRHLRVLPTRLLEIDFLGEVLSIRLGGTSQLRSKISYITLSYRWAQNHPFTLKKQFGDKYIFLIYLKLYRTL